MLCLLVCLLYLYVLYLFTVPFIMLLNILFTLNSVNMKVPNWSLEFHVKWVPL